MEVRQERVHDLKRRARHQEEVRLERAGGDGAAVRASRRFERAHGRRADRDDAMSFAFRPMHAFGGVRGDLHPLEIHPMLFDAIDFHGLERAEADVQRHARDLDAPRRDGGEQLAGEVEARGRRRDRAGALRENGLVVDRVLCVRDAAGAVDVGRQGSGTEGGRSLREEKTFLLPCFVNRRM